MPEVILYADENEYDIQTYVQIYNPIGFMMQIENRNGTQNHPERQENR